MPSFTNYKDLENWLATQAYDALIDSARLEQEMAEIMVQAVEDVVYAAYDPVSYERRKTKDRLGDIRNGAITDVLINKGQVVVVFENIAEGNDSLSGSLLADTIEEGIKANWGNPNGAWSDPRPFMAETARRINENPTGVINAVKDELRARGLMIG